MEASDQQLLVLTGDDGARYAIPESELDRFRVPDEHAAHFEGAPDELPEDRDASVAGHVFGAAPPALHLQWFRPPAPPPVSFGPAGWGARPTGPPRPGPR